MPDNKWIQKATSPKTRGALRKKLGAKEGQPIPMDKIDKATKSKNPKTQKQARLAVTLRKLSK
jgi:hypothetical protein